MAQAVLIGFLLGAHAVSLHMVFTSLGWLLLTRYGDQHPLLVDGAGLPRADVPAPVVTAPRVSTDLRVRSATPRRVVLEGTITVDLPER